MKKNNTAQKTLLEAQQISKALKEGTEKTLQSLIKEAIADMIDDETEETEEEPIEDDSFDVQDVETEETPTETDDETQDNGEEAETTTDDVTTTDDTVDDTDTEDEWSDMDDYKVGDNDYDFTGVDGDIALKVYNKLGDNDQIFVQKQEDGTYQVKDDETGAEFVIELDTDGEEENADAVTDDEPDTTVDDIDIDVDMDTEMPTQDDDEEIEIDLDDEDNDEEELNEDLGYTTQYQDNVMPTLKMNTSLKQGTREIGDNAVPKGTERPYAGKGESKPFEKKVNEACKEQKCCGKCGNKPCTCNEKEIDESAMTMATQPTRKTTISKHSQIRPNSPEEVKKVDGQINEAKLKKILEAAKAIQAENKKYQEVINEVKKSLYEAAVLNTNYGKIVNLLVNETTTKEEKKSIIERFDKVKTINEGKQLYESIKRELNESNKKSMPIIDEQISIEPSKTINETKIFQNNPSLDLMNRMDNLFKK